MFNTLFKNATKSAKRVDFEVNSFYEKLKAIYNFDSISDDRKNYLTEIMNEYGYLN